MTTSASATGGEAGIARRRGRDRHRGLHGCGDVRRVAGTVIVDSSVWGFPTTVPPSDELDDSHRKSR